jgi:hypothetical protein
MATIGQKELRDDYPVEEGLVAETTKQTGVTNLIAEEADITIQRNRVGLK